MELLKLPIALLLLLYLKGKLERYSILFISHGTSFLIQTQQIKKVFPFQDKKG